MQEKEASLAPVREEILRELARVAGKAMNRYSSNLQDQQRAKTAAFNLIRSYGHDGHILPEDGGTQGGRPSYLDPYAPCRVSLSLAANEIAANGFKWLWGREFTNPTSPRSPPSGATPGSPNSRRYSSWPELRDAVENSIAIATSHNDLLQACHC